MPKRKPQSLDAQMDSVIRDVERAFRIRRSRQGDCDFVLEHRELKGKVWMLIARTHTKEMADILRKLITLRYADSVMDGMLKFIGADQVDGSRN
jgi:hypothetical protein